MKNDFGKGVPALLDLANKIEKRKGIWPTDHDRQHSAEWLGRVMGYLAGPGHQADRGAQIEELAADLDSRLTGGRKEAYEHGRKSVAGRYKELQALAARPVEEVLAEAKQKRQELADAAREAEGEVKRFEEALVELKKPIHKQLEEIKRDMREAAAKANKAKRELPDAIELVDELSQPQVIPQVRTTTRNRVRTQMLTARAETAQEKKARETKLASAKQTLAQIQSSVDNAKQSLTDAKAKRDETQKLLKKTTAEKLPELTAARRKAQELSVRMRDADRMALTPEKLKSRVTALETYAPLDSESEKNRLLATLKTSS